MSPLCKVLYVHLFIWPSEPYYEIGAAVTPILQIRKLKVRVTQESHPAGEQRSQDVSPSGVLSAAVSEGVGPFFISRFHWNRTTRSQDTNH